MDIRKAMESALDAMPAINHADQVILADRSIYAALQAESAYYERWHERLFSPAGLAMLFPVR
jgi:hypothetical protein